jgi:hypothetical protein
MTKFAATTTICSGAYGLSSGCCVGQPGDHLSGGCSDFLTIPSIAQPFDLQISLRVGRDVDPTVDPRNERSPITVDDKIFRIDKMVAAIGAAVEIDGRARGGSRIAAPYEEFVNTFVLEDVYVVWARAEMIVQNRTA